MQAAYDRVTGTGSVTRRDSLGCSLTALADQKELAGTGFVVYRKTHDGAAVSRVETPPSGRGLLVGVALASGHRRRIFSGGVAETCQFEPDSCYVRSFSDTYRADIETGFDFFLLEISHAALHRSFTELDLPLAECVSCAPGESDPVLASLARALLPALAAPEACPPLFLDQVVSSMQTHLAARYHGGHARLGGGLSARQLVMGKEMLAAGLEGQVLIADIAAACGISRSHFIRGFKDVTGVTPYQWLLHQRIERARDLLVNTRMPLADVAISCGFSDQSHMTRTFTRLTGAAPGAWRRGH
ncbi:AraC family transcriptional regulator [Xanthobacter autotrophicus DSM 431]|uniref:helix-turn-helix transcriptional regulator n=1 Tax=Xanthobacter nonsaccharivorans TaxID=3119912 RepID=UPI00372C5ED6